MVKTVEDTYTDLPPLSVMVNSDTALVSTASTTECAIGGTSIPVRVSIDKAPFYDLSVGLAVIPLAEDAAFDAVSPSYGLTPPELAVTLDKDNGDALLVVACSDTMAAS